MGKMWGEGNNVLKRELRNMLGKTQSRRILSSPRATDIPRQVHPLQLTLKTKTGRKDLPHLVTEGRPQRKRV